MTTPEGVSAHATRGRTVETEVKPRTQHLTREKFSEGQFGKWSGIFRRDFKG